MPDPVGNPPTPQAVPFNFADPKFRATKKALFKQPIFGDFDTLDKRIAEIQAKLRGADPSSVATIMAEELAPTLQNLGVVVAVRMNEINVALDALEDGVDEAIEMAEDAGGGGNIDVAEANVILDAIQASLALCNTVISAYGEQLPAEQKAMIQAVADKCAKALPIAEEVAKDAAEEGEDDGEDGDEEDELCRPKPSPTFSASNRSPSRPWAGVRSPACPAPPRPPPQGSSPAPGPAPTSFSTPTTCPNLPRSRARPSRRSKTWPWPTRACPTPAAGG